MSNDPATSSWSIPPAADDRLLDGMTHEQQLAAYQARFGAPGCGTSTGVTIDDIVDRVRAARSMPELVEQ